jgi:hypothetical protein
MTLCIYVRGLGIVYEEKNFGLFGLFQHLKFFSAYFYAGCLEAEMRTKKLRT